MSIEGGSRLEYLSPRELQDARNRFYPGWHTYPEHVEDQGLAPWFRVVCDDLAEYRVACESKPPNVRAEIVLRDSLKFSKDSDETLDRELRVIDALRLLPASMIAIGVAIVASEPAMVEIADKEIVPNIFGLGLIAGGIKFLGDARNISREIITEANRRGLSVRKGPLTRGLERPQE